MPDPFKPKPPDWDVTLFTKSTKTRVKVGVGWTQTTGAIILKFDLPLAVGDDNRVVTLLKNVPKSNRDEEMAAQMLEEGGEEAPRKYPKSRVLEMNDEAQSAIDPGLKRIITRPNYRPE